MAFELLGAAGIHVDVAENGALGVQRVQEGSYELVLMDLQMPVMDGFEATRRIRAMPGCERLPILAMTANAMAGDRERSLAVGMNDHITKPIDPDELFDVLLRWLPERAGDAPVAVATPAAVAGSARLSTSGPMLEQIRGLDAADGLRRVLGRHDAYVGLLRRFASGHANAIRDIRAALADGRDEDAERAAHTLKGVAGTIGARQLQREAGEVEAVLHRGAVEIEPLLAPAERTLDDLITALLGALPPEAEATPVSATVDPHALAAAVGRLEQLLSNDAAEAVDAFETERPILTAAFGERAATIGTLIRRYRFEDALTALRASRDQGSGIGDQGSGIGDQGSGIGDQE